MIELVVIGGSAGALDGLLELLPRLQAPVMPIAVVIHLSPTAPNLVPAVLARAGAHRVVEAEDKMQLVAGTVYIAPPNYHLMIERDGTLSLSVDPPVNFSRPSIDVLFESAADAYGRRCAGLVLSGGNDDGAHGLACIHDAGGLAYVQEPATTRHPTMPRAAIARLGGAARVMALAEMATALLQADADKEPAR